MYSTHGLTDLLHARSRYENGGGFFHTTGLQYAALGVAGRADEAVAGFSTLMNSGFGKVRGWAQQLWWTRGGGPSR